MVPPRCPPVISTFGRLMATARRRGHTCAGSFAAAARADGVSTPPGAARTAKSRRRGRTPSAPCEGTRPGRGRTERRALPDLPPGTAFRGTVSHRESHGRSAFPRSTEAHRVPRHQASGPGSDLRLGPAGAAGPQAEGSLRPSMSGSGPGRPAEVGPGKGLWAARSFLRGLCIGCLSFSSGGCSEFERFDLVLLRVEGTRGFTGVLRVAVNSGPPPCHGHGASVRIYQRRSR